MSVDVETKTLKLVVQFILLMFLLRLFCPTSFERRVFLCLGKKRIVVLAYGMATDWYF